MSFAAATALAGLIPAEFLAKIYAAVYARSRGLRKAGKLPTPQLLSGVRERATNDTMMEWRESIRETGRLPGSRTLEALQPILLRWVGREHGYLCFHLIQILTRHGSFVSYLCRIGRDADDTCHHCGLEKDTAQHTLQDCPAWRVQRAQLADKVGRDLTLPVLVTKMLESEDCWRAAVKFAVEVMSNKEAAEREKERDGRRPWLSRRRRR